MTESPPTGPEYDVIIVGGGPAGCSAGVFTSRYGLDTVIFDRGRSSIQQCAYLENYLGFPAGVDTETFYALMHDHAVETGCEIVPDLVEAVVRADDGDGFVVETQEGRRVTGSAVVAASRYDGEYLRPVCGDGAFETYEYEGETHEQLDREYPGRDGRTDVEGLYIASPSDETDHQAIIAAGRGARVGLALIEDVRRDQGYPESVATRYDWVRQETAPDTKWRDRDHLRAWYDSRFPDDHGLDEDRRIDLRERDLDRRLDAYRSDEEIENQAQQGHDQLLEHIDDDRILEYARQIEDEGRSSEPNT